MQKEGERERRDESTKNSMMGGEIGRFDHGEKLGTSGMVVYQSRKDFFLVLCSSSPILLGSDYRNFFFSLVVMMYMLIVCTIQGIRRPCRTLSRPQIATLNYWPLPQVPYIRSRIMRPKTKMTLNHLDAGQKATIHICTKVFTRT